MAPGAILRVETLAAAMVHWTPDGWRTVHDAATRDTALGVHVVDLPTAHLPAGACVEFTFRWLGEGRWEGNDFEVRVGDSTRGVTGHVLTTRSSAAYRAGRFRAIVAGCSKTYSETTAKHSAITLGRGRVCSGVARSRASNNGSAAPAGRPPPTEAASSR